MGGYRRRKRLLVLGMIGLVLLFPVALGVGGTYFGALTVFAQSPPDDSGLWSVAGTHISNTNSGFVGIGTSAPTRTLTVNGSIGMSDGLYSGASLFLYRHGNSNTFLGVDAGNLTMTGSWNTAVGAYAFESNESGNHNTVLGDRALRANKGGSRNTALGRMALTANSEGSDNTAVGTSAMQRNKVGIQNTAVGVLALFDSRGSDNTAVGHNALAGEGNTGNRNTAVGQDALYANTTGSLNVAVGTDALKANKTGTWNTSVGHMALTANTSGEMNTALGASALEDNSSGSYNTAVGAGALKTSKGEGNTAVGRFALHSNTVGTYNTAIGEGALIGNTSGDWNIAIGHGAGTNAGFSADNNIYIGSAGEDGDHNVIRIGDSEEPYVVYVRGIYTHAVEAQGLPVYVTAEGNLGVVGSSARFKQGVADLGDASQTLYALRPVEFSYVPEIDPSGALQYGLIAEEVADVAPNLVVNDDAGAPYTVRYEQLIPLLLNELQVKDVELDALQASHEALLARLEALEEKVALMSP